MHVSKLTGRAHVTLKYQIKKNILVRPKAIKEACCKYKLPCLDFSVRVRPALAHPCSSGTGQDVADGGIRQDPKASQSNLIRPQFKHQVTDRRKQFQCCPFFL